MLSLQPHPTPTLICHGLYDGILQVSPVAYSYLVAKYQMSSGPYGPIFIFIFIFYARKKNVHCNSNCKKALASMKIMYYTIQMLTHN